ncbi:uncharacterized protein LOC114076877 [Solanum pennellii]|uniref:Uncharacterized protein LOC114076877 n=1 Tax=Solanum pennellii TaxID=28526 RepID=A0ABM1V9F9_SOLPN|nr:uncharacterized protein LOC114076877 [Solanum pennellii]
MIQHPDTDYIDSLDIEIKEQPVHCSHVENELDGLPWYFDIKKYLETKNYPDDVTSNQKKLIHRMSLNFFLSGEVLYRRTPDLDLLRCIDVIEAAKLIEQIHAGVCDEMQTELHLCTQALFERSPKVISELGSPIRKDR